jgi:3-oxoacyl-[acyl-carrier protein] reductase
LARDERAATGAEPSLEPLLRFLLSPRAAFITGQVVTLEPTPVSEWPVVKPLAGKVALVTGAGRGIGHATARSLAAEGAHVVCLERPVDGELAAQLASEIAGSIMLCDVREEGAADSIARELRARHGGVDVVVHNAGVTRDKTLQRMSAQQWDQVLDVNLRAVLQIDQALDGLLRDGGREICLASIAGIAGTMGQTNYAAAKAGLIGYVRKRAELLRSRGITVNAVAPGLIETRLTAAMPVFIREAGRRLSALGQGGEPRDVAEAVTFLASPGAGGINGSVLRVCGGAFLGA